MHASRKGPAHQATFLTRALCSITLTESLRANVVASRQSKNRDFCRLLLRDLPQTCAADRAHRNAPAFRDFAAHKNRSKPAATHARPLRKVAGPSRRRSLHPLTSRRGDTVLASEPNADVAGND